MSNGLKEKLIIQTINNRSLFTNYFSFPSKLILKWNLPDNDGKIIEKTNFITCCQFVSKKFIS